MNKLYKISFGWGQEIAEEDVLRIANVMGVREPNDIVEKREKDGKLVLRTWNEYTVDIEWLIVEFPNIRFEVRGISSTGRTNFIDSVDKIASKLEKLANTEQLFNERCNVHVPGFGLVMYNEVKNVDDYCTEQLQDMLDDGWRIIAACPQPDQRRPDYILGRYNQDKR